MRPAKAVSLRSEPLLPGISRPDIRRVTDAAHFVDDLRADWLDHLELLILIEEHFPGMQITEQDAEQLQTVGDLIRYITDWDQRSTATTRTPGALTTGPSQA